ncbi:HlyD family secretion protein [Pedobacter sp. MR2016-24]|uniref:HlyD family secretion protein n=1 Tax=Pedobacter sp. MR2016-24 TaxID=2994466 RepID=UPI002246CF45|nr:HlyD family secretion protein [Pedobacter sp. MR2016-24]MCX2483814.1 HlyD family secretion protein [Pedobacter sp. MR2016-24]
MKTQNYTTTDKMITRVTSWVAAGLLLILIIMGIGILRDRFRYEKTNDAQVQEYINPVVTRVSGYVKEVRFEENQVVNKGDTLIKIDPSQFQLQELESAEATANARAELEVLESNIVTATRLAAVSESQIAAVRARLTKQEKDYSRYSKLFTAESATAQQVETTKEGLDIARSDYESALGNYRAALSRIDDYRAQKSGLTAEIRRRNAVQQRTNLDLTYTAIIAPYKGKMGRRTIQNGEFVQANQTLANIVNQDADKWVIANFKETQIGKMKIGQPVLIETDAFPDEVFHGEILSLSPGTGSSFSLLPPDNATGNFVKIVQRIPVKVKFTDQKNRTGLLRAGMNATVKVIRP